MRRNHVLASITLLAALGITACGGSAPPASEAQPPAATPPAAAAPPAVAPAPVSPPTTGAEAPPSASTGAISIPANGKKPDPGLPVVRELTQEFYRGELAKLYSKFSAEMKKTMTVENLEKMRTHVESTYGKETAVLSEDWATKGKYRGFVRFARFDKYEGVVEVMWMLHVEDDEVAGFFVRPAKTSPKTGG